MKANPLVSVIIPTHNRPDRLIEAIRSVDEQSYTNIELIIVDDASDAQIKEIINKQELDNIPSIKYHKFNENKGANAARNKGIDMSEGKYLAFLDDDDRWKKNKIRKQVEVFESSEAKVGVVYTGLGYYENGDLVRERLPSVCGSITKNLLTGDFVSPFSAIMVKRSVINEAGKLDERFPSMQDRDWYIRISKWYDFKPITEPLTIHRVGHSDQITYNYYDKKNISIPLLIKKHQHLSKEYGLLAEYRMKSWLYSLLAGNAMNVEEFSDARIWSLKSIVAYPLNHKSYYQLLAVIGGKYTYRSIKRVKELTYDRM